MVIRVGELAVLSVQEKSKLMCLDDISLHQLVRHSIFHFG